MLSLAPKDYESLPQLGPPAGYICVLRDIDSDRYRIEGAQQPKALVDSIYAETRRRFGLELVAVLATEDIAASAAQLYDNHFAELSGDWLALDRYQLDELRQSNLDISAFESHYLARPERTDPGEGLPARGALPKPSRSGTLGSIRYGADSLRRRRPAFRNQDWQPVAPPSLKARLGHGFDQLWLNYPVQTALAIVILALVAFASVDQPNRVQIHSVTVMMTQEPTVTPKAKPTLLRRDGAPYLVTRLAPVYTCPSRTCQLVSRLAARTQVQELMSVIGAQIGDSPLWIEFRLNGEPAFVHSSYLTPLETDGASSTRNAGD